MLTIRLARRGKKKQPTYRLIISEKRRDTKGSFLELLGFYLPRTNPPQIQFKADRIRHWLARGAQASDTVWNLLIREKIIEGKKRPKGKAKKAESPPESGDAKPAEPATPQQAEKAKAPAA